MERKAKPFAEEAIRAIGRRDVPVARTSIAQAFDADHKISQLVDAVNLACAEIEEEDLVSTGTWDILADAVADSDLYAVVEMSRP